jgi:integrase
MIRGHEVPVTVCQCKGEKRRFFGKYKDPDEADPKKKWKKIPGGPFGPEIDTRAKAMACARRWFETEMAERQLPERKAKVAAVSWPDVVDAFCLDVKARLRGADASKHEAEKRAAFLRRSAILCSRAVAEHDDTLAVAWVRTMLSEPLGRKGREDEPRDALTVRNVARVLDAIYKFAQARGYFPKTLRRPTEAEEFKAEISGALREKQKLGQEGRVACPVETAKALVNCEAVPELRRIMARVAFFTGARPGELHAWRVGDLREEHGVWFLDIREQWTLAHKGFPSRLAPLKTVWCKRKVPVHSSLIRHLRSWIEEGWERHVGHKPEANDYLFPNADAAAFREVSSVEFLADLRTAGCETVHKGHTLDIYSLRHAFATAAKRARIFSEARDRLLGHRPKDTKSLYYEDEDQALPLLAEEIAKIPALLDDAVSAPGTSSNGTDGGAAGEQQLHDECSTALYAIKSRTTPTIETEPPIEPPSLVSVLVSSSGHGADASSDSLMISAEEEGFEPTVPLRVRRFSKPVPSTARPLLREWTGFVARFRRTGRGVLWGLRELAWKGEPTLTGGNGGLDERSQQEDGRQKQQRHDRCREQVPIRCRVERHADRADRPEHAQDDVAVVGPALAQPEAILHGVPEGDAAQNTEPRKQ